MKKPLLLDLFCGAGGAAMGYHRAGFDVVGVDTDPQPNYPFEFHRLDATTALLMLEDYPAEFDAIHASPPCQHYLNLGAANRAQGREYDHPNMIAPVRDLLRLTGKPYVIENVVDARAHLRNPIQLCGTSFGLPLRRHRLFETTFSLLVPPCAHHLFTEPKYWTGWRPGGEKRLATTVQVYGNGGDQAKWADAMGIDWMVAKELAEAIPPAYTEYIGWSLQIVVKGAA